MNFIELLVDMKLDESIIEEFVSDVNDSLETIEDDLLSLENQAENADLEIVDSIFRTLHSIKGTSGFMDLHNLSKLAHSAENILSQMRKGEIKPTSAIIDALLRTIDIIRTMLDDIERSNDMDISRIQQELDGLLQKDAPIQKPVKPDKNMCTNEILAETIERKLDLSKAKNRETMDGPADIIITKKYSVADNVLRTITPAEDATTNIALELAHLIHQRPYFCYSKYLFDFSHLDNIDSITLSVLQYFGKMINSRCTESQLEIVNASKYIVSILENAGLNNYYSICHARAA